MARHDLSPAVPPLTKRDARQLSGRFGSYPPDPFEAVYTYLGAIHQLEVTLGQRAYTPLVCGLFVNDWVPARNDTISDYTLCTLPLYAPITLVPGEWVQLDTPPEATFAYPTITFSFGPYVGPNVSIWGYVVTDTYQTVLVWAQAFSEPQSVPLMGSTLPLGLVWTDRGRSH